ncbi:hypothetical protein M1615_03980 [Patescibacteria group bacterium]|nr:hypothetical protein [Patescibacteria group bacterium]
MKKTKIVPIIIFILLLFLSFRSWFNTNSVIAYGDYPFFWKSWLGRFSTNYTIPFSAWAPSSGLGGEMIFLLGSAPYDFITGIALSVFRDNWNLVQRVVWLWPFLLISAATSYYLAKKILAGNKFVIFAPFIFVFNTYILMVVGGGQIAGVGLAYSISPLVLIMFIKLINSFTLHPQNFKSQTSNLKSQTLAGLVLAIQVMFDPRIAYITMAAAGLYWFLSLFLLVKQEPVLLDKFKNQNSKIKITAQKLKVFIYSFIFVFMVPIIAASLLHAFWLLPFFLYHQNPIQQLGSAYSTVRAVKYFSFARFEQAISLLSPYWPENIFGKVGFMRPEFLILPILAFSSLLFVTSSKIKNQKSKLQFKIQDFNNNSAIEQSSNKTVIFFALLGLIGAFLAKGAQEPLGQVYLWLFDHFPGFIMFRDPTKWYTLVALSYSILIPFTLWKIYEYLNAKIKSQKSKVKITRYIPSLFLILTALYLILLIRPALFGQLTGTFKSRKVPHDYVKLEKFLSSQKTFSRTFWVPTTQRFGFYDTLHPEVSAQAFFNLYNYSRLLKKIRTSDTEKLLREAGVKYVIVPDDSQREIFLTDRKYNNKLYLQTINELKKIKWLRELHCGLRTADCGFGRIAVFEVPRPKSLFWLKSKVKSQKSKAEYKEINPTKYEVKVSNAKKGDLLVFSESYDKYWIAKSPISNLQSQTYDGLFNSFRLSKNGSYSLEIYYAPQKWVDIGLIISGLSFFSVIAYIIFGLRRRK